MARERSGGPSPPEEGAATPIPLGLYRPAGVAATDPWGFESHPLRHSTRPPRGGLAHGLRPSLRASRRASWVNFCQSGKVDQDFIPLHVYWKGRHRPTRGRPNQLAVADIENTAVPGARDPVPLDCPFAKRSAHV